MSNGSSSRKEQANSGTPTQPIRPIEEEKVNINPTLGYGDYANDPLAAWKATELSGGSQAVLDKTREAGAGTVKTTGGIPSPEHQKRIDAKKAKIDTAILSEFGQVQSSPEYRSEVSMKSGGTSMGSGKSSTSSGIKMCGSQIGKHMK
jgi:hypothetical protein